MESPVYSHNPYRENAFPLLVLDVNRQSCVPFNEGFRVLHWHDEIQLVYLSEGEVCAEIYGERAQVGKGDCLFLNRGVLHRITEQKACRYHSYLIPPKMLSFFAGSMMQQNDVEPVLNNPQLTHRLFSVSERENGDFLEKMRQLDSLYFAKEKPDHPEYRLSLAIAQVWLELIRLLPQQEISGIRKAEPGHERIREMISFLHTNYANHISLEQTAQSAHVSKSECIRCFHRYLGEPPYTYLKKYRLHCSLSLLQNRQLSVTEIAMRVGFRCASSYIGYFKQEYGKTPKAYREEILGKTKDER